MKKISSEIVEKFGISVVLIVIVAILVTFISDSTAATIIKWIAAIGVGLYLTPTFINGMHDDSE